MRVYRYIFKVLDRCTVKGLDAAYLHAIALPVERLGAWWIFHLSKAVARITSCPEGSRHPPSRPLPNAIALAADRKFCRATTRKTLHAWDTSRSTVVHTRRFDSRAACAARYARSGKKVHQPMRSRQRSMIDYIVFCDCSLYKIMKYASCEGD